MAAVTPEQDSCFTVRRRCDRLECNVARLKQHPQEGSAMSATDKLVEKNCKLAELRYFAGHGAVSTRLRVLTSTSSNRLGLNSRSLTRPNLATRQIDVVS